MTHVTEAVLKRISTRAFTSEPVSRDVIARLLETAQRAPSGGNLQPWRTIAVSGAAKQAVTDLALARLSENPSGEPTDRDIYPPNLWEPLRSRRFAVGEEMYDLLGIPREDKLARLGWFSRNYNFFNAPAALFFVVDTRLGHGQWGHVGMYLQTIALLAEEAGLGTCMQECWGVLRQTLKQHFSLGETEMIWCAMAIGHPDRDAKVNQLRTARAAPEDVTEWYGF